MARPKVTNYFSHDSNARNDEKIIRLRMRHGAAGYGVYFMLLERMREEEDCVMSKDYDMIAFDLRVESSLVESVVEDFGLFNFTEDNEQFYSESFNRRMDAVRSRSEVRKKSARSRWDNNNGDVEVCKIDANASENDANASEIDANAMQMHPKMIQTNKTNKEKEIKENTPSNSPTGELGGGAFSFSSIFYTAEQTSIRSALASADVSEADIWEFCRLVSATDIKVNYGKEMANYYQRLPAAQRKEHPFYEVLQGLQRMEQEGRITPAISFEDFTVQQYIATRLSGSDSAAIYRTIGTPPHPMLLEELRRLVKECTRPGNSITQPGKFILAGLRKLLSTAK